MYKQQSLLENFLQVACISNFKSLQLQCWGSILHYNAAPTYDIRGNDIAAVGQYSVADYAVTTNITQI